MQEHIDIFHKESEICAAYLEHITAHFNNIANITIDSDIITPHKKKNTREENIQKDHEIPFYKNEANKSIIASETIVQNASKKIVPNASEAIQQTTIDIIKQTKSKKVNVSKKIGQNARKKFRSGTAKYFLTCNNNLLEESRQMTTPLGKSLRNDIANRTDPTSQPTIIHFKQEKLLKKRTKKLLHW